MTRVHAAPSRDDTDRSRIHGRERGTLNTKFSIATTSHTVSLYGRRPIPRIHAYIPGHQIRELAPFFLNRRIQPFLGEIISHSSIHYTYSEPTLYSSRSNMVGALLTPPRADPHGPPIPAPIDVLSQQIVFLRSLDTATACWH